MILGIDPGLATIGYAFVKGTNKDPIIEDYGILETKAQNKEFLAYRLLEIGNDLQDLITKYKPIKAIVEDLFFFKNLKTAINVAQSRGVILYILQKNNVEINSVTPLQVKQSVCGYGRATKKQIQNMIQRIYNLDDLPFPDDASDSLAMAWLGLK